MASSNKLSATDGTLLDARKYTRYRSIMSSLQYLTMTRPGLFFAINKVCQYLHVPRSTRWEAVKWILRYGESTISHGLLLRPDTRSSDILFTFLMRNGLDVISQVMGLQK
jgi:hypothetical protein